MKVVAILSVIVLVFALGGVGYLYLTANITVEAVGATAMEAALQEAVFDSLKAAIAQGSHTGTLFRTDALGEAADYKFVTYTVRLHNACMLTADMVEVQVTSRDGDVLQLSSGSAKALQGGVTGDVTATVLTAADSLTARELTITYYIWGIPFSMKTTCL